jgi:hypothetical protein
MIINPRKRIRPLGHHAESCLKNGRLSAELIDDLVFIGFIRPRHRHRPGDKMPAGIYLYLRFDQLDWLENEITRMCVWEAGLSDGDWERRVGWEMPTEEEYSSYPLRRAGRNKLTVLDLQYYAQYKLHMGYSLARGEPMSTSTKDYTIRLPSEVTPLKKVTNPATRSEELVRVVWPNVKPALVHCRGGKARLVTKAEAWLQALIKPINKQLLRLLARDPTTSSSLKGKGARNLCGQTPRPEDLLHSADLTAASDHIPHEVAAAVIDGLADGLGWCTDTHLAARLAVGPLLAEYHRPCDTELPPEQRGLCKTLIKRGVMMGLPLAWPILSILNLYACYTAQRDDELINAARRAAPTIRRTPTEGSVRSTRVGVAQLKALSKHVGANNSVCGDDAIIIGPQRQYISYRECILQMGLVLNETKTFHSRNEGVFVEENVTLGLRSSGERTVKVTAIPKVSRIITAAVSESMPGTLADGDRLPQTHSLGPAIRSTMEAAGDGRHVVKELMLQVHAKTVQRLRKCGMPLNLPQEFGGAGIPGNKDAPVSYRLAVATWIRGGSRSPPTHLWRQTRGSSGRHRVRLILGLETTTEGVDRSQAVITATSLANRDALLQGEGGSITKYVPVELIANYFRRAVRMCTKQKDLHPISRAKVWSATQRLVTHDRVNVSQVRDLLADLAPDRLGLMGSVVQEPLHRLLPLGHTSRQKH